MQSGYTIVDIFLQHSLIGENVWQRLELVLVVLNNSKGELPSWLSLRRSCLLVCISTPPLPSESINRVVISSRCISFGSDS